MMNIHSLQVNRWFANKRRKQLHLIGKRQREHYQTPSKSSIDSESTENGGLKLKWARK
jgi:hypothetical protein